MIPKDLIAAADRVMYVCRSWSPKYKAMQMSCADCGAKVAVSPAVLADRRKQVHAVGRSLAIVCDDCAFAAGAASGAIVAVLPSAEEIAST